ncbi:MAG: alanine racemase [Myxococcota bacterium]
MGEDAEREARRRAWAEIDLGALARNFRAIRARAVGKRVIAVVKANGYGHGAVLVSRALADAGCDAFAVISVDEGAELRAAGIRAPILVLGGALTPAEAERALALDLEPVVSRIEVIDWLEAAAARAGRELRFQLELDTGMGRLGVLPGELVQVLARVARAERLRLTGVMSHLACADDAASPQTERQRTLFGELVAQVRAAGFAPAWIHMDNSAGIARGTTRGTDAVRPGISLYGVDPTLEGGHALEPVMSLCARVAHAKTVEAGTPIGYAGAFRAAERTRILTLAIGYADGLPRAAGNRVSVGVRGRRAPLVGRVSCDLATAALPADDASAPGDAALIFGRRDGLEVPVEELARAVGTISYEVLVRIGPRVPRLAT